MEILSYLVHLYCCYQTNAAHPVVHMKSIAPEVSLSAATETFLQVKDLLSLKTFVQLMHEYQLSLALLEKVGCHDQTDCAWLKYLIA